MKKFISVILSLIVILSLASCSSASNQMYSNESVILFDTYCSISAYDSSQKRFDEHYSLVFDELQKYSMLFDIYNSYDELVNLKYINENAALSPVKADEKIIDILEYGKKAHDLTDGRVNIAMGSVLSVWHEKREQGIDNPENAVLPEMKELKRNSEHCDINKLIIDEENHTVYFNDSEMQLDIGAIAKGYVTEKICGFIKENNIWQSAVISLGGNVKVIGTKYNDGSSKFNIAVESPKDDDYLCTVGVSDGYSVVTSGDYQRYYTVDGVDYCHIINPDTLMPSDFMSSVTVICKDSSFADITSTMLFNMSIRDGLYFVEHSSNLEAVWVDKDNGITYSSGFKDYMN
ncbi:MAG: FAD:protein FMN transferase [Eubacterium sp.]